MKRTLSAVLFSFALTAAAAPGAGSGGVTPSPGKKKIVIIGDSITEGYGVAKDKAYPALIQKKADEAKLDWEVVNAGISGSTTSSAGSRVTWQLKQKPALIVLALGANDGLRGTDPKTVESNVASAIEQCKNARIKILLAGMKLPPNYGEAYVKKFEIIWPRLASRFKIPFAPFLLEGVAGRSDLNLADGIHPNEKGHVIIGESMFEAIKKAL